MIQTQLLRLDPPYQIISAGGRVGIQVATLIVVEEPKPIAIDQLTGRAQYYEPMKYHSHPVVCYGLKQGLEEQMKYHNNPFDDQTTYEIHRRLKPEGAVWAGVEVKDVRVLGLAGADNAPVGLSQLISLIPTARGYDPSLCVWDKISTSLLYGLYTGLGDVGMHVKDVSISWGRNEDFPIRLILEPHQTTDSYLVKVAIKEDEYGDSPWEEIYIRCLINPSEPDSIRECAENISEALNAISQALPTTKLSISWCQRMRTEDDVDYSEAMKQLEKLVKDNYKGYILP